MLPAELEFIATDTLVKIRPTVKMDKLALLSVSQAIVKVMPIAQNHVRHRARAYMDPLLVTGRPLYLYGWP